MVSAGIKRLPAILIVTFFDFSFIYYFHFVFSKSRDIPGFVSKSSLLIFQFVCFIDNKNIPFFLKNNKALLYKGHLLNFRVAACS